MKIVLLPGLDGTGVLFKPFIEVLPNKLDVLVISYPSNSILGYEELIELVYSQLPKEEFILVAESFSGHIAYQVALRKPNNLQSIFFVATFLENPRPFLLNLFGCVPRQLLLSAPLPTYVIKTYLLGADANEKMIGLLKQSIKRVSPRVLSHRLQQIAKLRNNQKPCNIKATYIQVTDDKLVPERCLTSFKKVFSNISTFQIKGSHFILQSNPLACTEVLVNENAL